MKNLKKVLSLVLALAMALSLMTVAFAAVPKAADLKNYDKVGSTYTQAVDAMVAIGVIDGVSGDIQAQGNVTREQAAKIICTMLMGSNASSLSTTSQYFSDVPATRWSAPYIGYCVEQGIVSGVGGGKFNPTGNVTGNQFAKMLLVALGYKADTEGYTGTNWAVNVSGDAADAGIYKGATALDKNTAATREQACLYAWNTVCATLVEYATTGTNITIGNTNINVGGSKATAKTSTDGTVSGNIKGTYGATTAQTLEFGEKYFPTLRLTTGLTDDFGDPSTTIKVGTTTVGNYASSAVVTYTGATKAATVASDLSGYTITNANPNPAVDVSVNNTTTYAAGGFTSAAIVVKNAASATTIASDATYKTVAAVIAHETANGKTVKVFADTTGLITKIVEVTYTVGTVSAVTKATSGTTYTLKATNGTTTVTGTDYVDGTDTISFAAAPAKGDVVTYVTVNGTTYVYPTTNVSGIQTANSTYYSTITVGGTSYTVATGVDGVAMNQFANSTKTATYYIDQYGYAVATTAASASTDYAYIIASYGSLTTSIDGSVPSAQVKVVKADGTVATYTLKLTKLTADTTTQYKFNSTTEAGQTGDYIITGTTFGVYNKSAAYAAGDVKDAVSAFVTANPVIGYTIADTTLTAETHETASSSMDGSSVYVSSSTSGLGYGVISKTTTEGAVATINNAAIYVVYNTATGTASVYTGNSGLPTAATGLTGYIVAKSTVASGAACTASVVFCKTATTYSSTAVAYAYINASKYSQGYDAKGNAVYTYYATSPDGSAINLTLTPATSATITSAIAENGIYSYNSDNTVNAAKATTGTVAGGQYFYGTGMTIANNVLTGTSGTSVAYNITDDTKIVYIDSTKSAVSNSNAYVVLALSSSNTVTNNVATIYVVG